MNPYTNWKSDHDKIDRFSKISGKVGARQSSSNDVTTFSSQKQSQTCHSTRSGTRSKQALPPSSSISRLPNVTTSSRRITRSMGSSSTTFPKSSAIDLISKKTPHTGKDIVPSCVIQTKNYTIRPVIPAKKKELIAVATAMHREAFAPRLKCLFQPETDAAIEAISSGIYVGFRCPQFTWDCIRLGSNSRCFCDHALQEHDKYNARKVNLKCKVDNCTCRSFQFIPQRPEDIGEFWLQKRPGFDVSKWRAKCRCKHTHVQHNPVSRKCMSRGCRCFIFESNFLCAACDKHWEEHETSFDDTKSRIQKGLPHGEDYIPFHELPELESMCLDKSQVDSMSLTRDHMSRYKYKQ